MGRPAPYWANYVKSWKPKEYKPPVIKRIDGVHGCENCTRNCPFIGKTEYEKSYLCDHYK